MSAQIIPFGRPLALTRVEFSQVAAWCAALGPRWWAEEVHADDGGMGIAVGSAWSRRDALDGSLFPRWQMERTRRGIAVFRAEDFADHGVYPTLHDAMSALAHAETGHPLPVDKTKEDGEQTA